MSLHQLTAQYLQQLDPTHLTFPPPSTLIHPDAQSAIYNRMFNQSTAWPLPPVSYRIRVLKALIPQIEEGITDPDEDELNSDLLEEWTNLISLPKPSQIQQAQQLTFIKYTAPTSPPAPTAEPKTVITSESRGLIYAAGTTGFRTWEASLHLGTYLSTPTGAAHVNGKRVIELGAGTGFVSMFVAKYLQPQFVLATDREGALIGNMKECKGRNELGAEFNVGAWEWGTPLEYPGGDNTEIVEKEDLTFDVALGADLVRCFVPSSSSGSVANAEQLCRPTTPICCLSSLPLLRTFLITTMSKNSFSQLPYAIKTPSRPSWTPVQATTSRPNV
ncbi:hypothetical protein BDV25DRAFT_166197 [Aspergillus avenaceus]|uniref:Methyltransferase-domain-containing protein n=1 Tax=Aspergillus avenaceus TaxID=36643 RepID=A0A5N6TEB6_ASPAV|nr:hypothetical protein BDV25DRAFT_166197 [Aspergillus avenaceus]